MENESNSKFEAVRKSYDQMARDGLYGRMPAGISGKYDNVRLYWENQVLRFATQAGIRSLWRRLGGTRGLRIVDLGCGSGEGWDLLMRLPAGDRRLPDSPFVLREEDIEAYVGVDLSEGMVEEARLRHASNVKASFFQGDLTDPDRIFKSQAPFDLYFSSFGAMSHLDDGALERLLAGIARHATGPAIIVLDVHGQFSPEWPCHWGYSRKPGVSRMARYSMSWIRPETEAPAAAGNEDYLLRYWGGGELEAAIRAVPGMAARLSEIRRYDRSVFVGRHMDTGSFNRPALRVRRAVNELFEWNTHPALHDMLVPPLPDCPDAEANQFLADFRHVWNTLVEWMELVHDDNPASAKLEMLLRDFSLPQALLEGAIGIAGQIQALRWMEPGDPLSNVIQPLFGLLLRQAEYTLQRGLGCGHGLIAIVELNGT